MENKIALLAKYNYWGEGKIELGYIRKSYVDKLYAFTNNNLIKVLVGQRRVGKSYLLRQLAARLIEGGVDKNNVIMLNLEFSDFDFVKDFRTLEELIQQYMKERSPSGRVYIFVDEIQYVADWEKFVNTYSQDYTQNYELFVTGSNSQMLSSELATLLSGRYVSVEMLPFSYVEYAEMRQKTAGKSSYLEYMSEGGLPELFHLEQEEIKRSFVASLRDTVLLRDIVQRYEIKDVRLLEDLFVYVLNNASNLLSVNGIAKYVKGQGRSVSYNTVASYLKYIENAYLIYHVDKYNVKGKSVLGRTCKYYANDLAFKNYLYGGFGYGVGYKLENLVYLELRRSGYEIYTGDCGNKEIDFVAQKNDRKIYVQAAYSVADEETARREYAPLEELNDAYGRYVVTLDDFKLNALNGIQHVQAWDFGNFI